MLQVVDEIDDVVGIVRFRCGGMPESIGAAASALYRAGLRAALTPVHFRSAARRARLRAAA